MPGPRGSHRRRRRVRTSVRAGNDVADRSAAPVAQPKSRQARGSWARVQRAVCGGVSGVEGAGAGWGGVSSASLGFAASGAGGVDVSGWAGFAAGLSRTIGGAGGGVWRTGGGGGGIDDGGCVFGAGGREPASVTSRAQVRHSGRSPVRVRHRPRYWRAARWRRSMATCQTDAESTGEDDAGSGCAKPSTHRAGCWRDSLDGGRRTTSTTDAESTVEDEAGPASSTPFPPHRSDLAGLARLRLVDVERNVARGLR